MLRRNVLILHAGALGDYVLTWPLIVALARLYPQSRIFTVTHAAKGKLAAAVLGVESADLDAGWHGMYAGDPPSEPVGRLLAGAHTILNFVSGAADPFAASLARFSDGATVIHLQPTPGADFSRHATQFHLEQLSSHPTIHAALEQILAGTTRRGLGRRPATGPDILLHPGSGAVEKCWPLEQFLELADRLGSEAPVKVVLGEVERERFTPAQIQRLEQSVPARHCDSYLDLLNALNGAAAFIGNDSGPSHLAGLLGLPTLALFGPTQPAVWRPLGPRVEVVRHQPLAKLQVSEVLKGLARLRAAAEDGSAIR